MQNIKPDLEALNGYVDGELSRDDAAIVARAIASDPAVARKVAALTALRSALADSTDVPELQIDDLVPAPESDMARDEKSRNHHKWMAIAACLAGLLIVSSFGYRDMVMQGDEAWVTSVLKAHDSWTLEGSDTDTPSIQPVSSLSSDLARLVYVPDLTSAKLQMVYVNSEYRADDAAVFVAGYTGTRGCKITLVAQIAEGVLGESPQEIGTTDLRAIAWNAGALDYILMSEGMDNDRFELIAATVRDSSLNHQPVNSQTRVALSVSRELSAPCTA